MTADRVAVIGGTGNVGEPITDALLERGFDVTVISRGHAKHGLGDDVAHIVADRDESDALRAALVAARPGVVIDLACFTGQMAAALCSLLPPSVAQVILCSSIAVYGVPDEPIDETTPLRPTSSYGAGKVAAEHEMARALGDGCALTVFRLPYTYGKVTLLRQLGWDGRFVDRLRKGKRVVVEARAGETRMHALAAVDAAEAFAHSVQRTACASRAYNLPGTELTWLEYHRAAARAVTDAEIEHVFVDRADLVARDDGRLTSFLDGTAYDLRIRSAHVAKDLPEFGATADLVDGLRTTVRWMDENQTVRNSNRDRWEDEIVEMALGGRR